MQPNQRNSNNYRSAAWGFLAFYRPVGADDRDERLAVVEDFGPGGLFIATDDPPPVGTVLQLRIYSHTGPAGRSVMPAHAIVRWHRQSVSPRGIGVQFLDSEELATTGMESWLDSLAPSLRPAPDPVPDLSGFLSVN
ncbi:MAG TPA: PilZ domain-containing protein [Thermoanaerobaculia bacterium]|nr:PilZ domain-containing protein [Thermoanaerobaculia bacterium]